MDTQESFFPEIAMMGDVLQEAGYSQTLLIGSDATFGGRRLYFTEHGNYDIIDYNYALEQGGYLKTIEYGGDTKTKSYLTLPRINWKSCLCRKNRLI